MIAALALAILSASPAPAQAQAPTDTTSRSRRLLLIGGAMDGLAASPAALPCASVATLEAADRRLLASGVDGSDPAAVPDALLRGDPPGRPCASQDDPIRDAQGLLALPDEDLAVYLTGAVRGYARTSSCPEASQARAATLAVAAISLADPDTSAVDALRIALREGCSPTP